VGDPASTETATALAVGDVVADRYRIDALLGQGGMGVVYRVEHLHLRKPLALKVLLPEWSSMPEVVARFEREAIAASNIQSPHVAAATDFGRLPNGSFFLVMELVGGSTLRDVLEAGALETARALRIARGIASGLHSAHSLGIVHRDLKPENVMLIERDGEPDFVKLLDFGIAKVSGFGGGSGGGGSGVLTRVGAVIGTPDYMAPEQAMGQAIDARTDLYSVGVILYEMLAGRRPFVGEAVTVLRQHVLAEVPDLPPTVVADLPPSIASLLRRLLAKDVANRFQNADELLEALDAAAAEVGTHVRTPPAQKVLRSVVARMKAIEVAATQSLQDPLGAMRQPGRRPMLVAAAIATATVALLVTLLALGGTRTPTTKAATPVASSAQADIAPPTEPILSSTAEKSGDVPTAAAALPPPPVPTSSGSDEGSAGTPTSSSSGEHRTQTQRKSRKTGPGGIYIPPPSQWFK
jgi:serine/threonine-protein kinase